MLLLRKEFQPGLPLELPRLLLGIVVFEVGDLGPEVSEPEDSVVCSYSRSD